jgi:phytoene dehydrogenase-like protein
MRSRGTYDAVIVGGGHNGLVAATLLGRAGLSVLVLERRERLGGAAISGSPFAGVAVRLSRYAYLVSLFPRELLRTLGVDVELRRRRVSSYTPDGNSGLLVAEGSALPASDASGLRAAAGSGLSGAVVDRDPALAEQWRRFYGMIGRVAARLFPTLTEPLLDRGAFRGLIGDDEAGAEAWEALFEQPLSVVLEQSFSSDLARGVVLTDGTIGTFAPADDPLLRQNRCFLYHLIGNGTGHWDVPIGGMGALTEALERSARAAGAEIRANAEVVSIRTDGTHAEVACGDGHAFSARHVLANVAPSVLARLLGEDRPTPADARAAAGAGGAAERAAQAPAAAEHSPSAAEQIPEAVEGAPTAAEPAPEGSQLKINMLLRRLPRLRDAAVSAEEAFAGTFHVNEGYSQLQRAYEQAAAGQIPSRPPCELYCHSLTDPSILSAELRAAGAQTLTLFGLHMPARLFRDPATHADRKAAAIAATLESLNSVLAEPIENCMWRAADGTTCIEALTPPELESELGMPGGHIFHRDLAWPFAESEHEIGTWGAETAHPNIWICGAGARRGGGVSGIPGHNAARAVLDAWRRGSGASATVERA